MTAQISDTALYCGDDYSIIGLIAPEPVTPLDFGMTPTKLSTGCYRGYYCTYVIEDSQLYLAKMTLRERNGRYLAIGGVDPIQNELRNCANYEGLRVFVSYTGALRLARGFIRSLYIHMGYQKASAFETVLDFDFKDGRVTGLRDRSAEAAQKRGAFKEHFDQNVTRGINESFDLDMEIW